MSAWHPTETQRAMFRWLIEANGAPHQQVKAAEEYAEASAAIARYVNGYGTLGEVAAELADTEIMRAQLCEMSAGLDVLIAEQVVKKLLAMHVRFGFPVPEKELSGARRIYLASSWRNPMQPHAVQMLRDNGHEVYDFRNPAPGNTGFAWSEIDPAWLQWTPEQFIPALEHPTAASGYSFDKAALDWCDTCILLLPCGRSAHLEAGYAIGQGKQTVIVLHEDKFEPELMYLMAGHANIVPDLQAMLQALN